MRRAFDVCDALSGHEAAQRLWQHVKPQAMAGTRGRMIWEPIDLTYRHQLRKLFHGPILETFAWNVRLIEPESGRLVRYTPAVWKLHLAGLFCPSVSSTEELGDEEFAAFIMACEAYGVMDCGIEFPEKEASHAAPNRI